MKDSLSSSESYFSCSHVKAQKCLLYQINVFCKVTAEGFPQKIWKFFALSKTCKPRLTALYGPHLFNSHHYMSTYGYSYSAVSIIVCKFIRKHTNTSNTYGSKSYKLYVHIHRKQCQHVKRNKLPRWALAPVCVCDREMKKELLHFPPAPGNSVLLLLTQI